GQVSLDGRAVGTPTDKQLAELRDRLKNIAPRLTAPIALQVDSAARHERLVDVLDAAGSVGVSLVLAD
ncbi:MAG: hypothetical protein J7559_10900, partial [Cohnella sp.]|nr:hypothetical protein [Cohnella sp.]